MFSREMPKCLLSVRLCETILLAEVTESQITVCETRAERKKQDDLDHFKTDEDKVGI